MKTTKVHSLDPSSVHVRLGLCAAALVGTAAAVPTAEATVITFSVPIPVPATLAGVYINLLTGFAGGSAGGTPGWDFNPYLQGGGTMGVYWSPTLAGGLRGAGVASTTTGPFLDLAPGTTISGASVFTSSIAGGTAGSPFLTTGTHILGFRFVNDVTGLINFGYMTMTNTGTTGFPTTVLSWSFDDTGAAITIPVPEPTTAALLTMAALAIGALGLRNWRRQRVA